MNSNPIPEPTFATVSEDLDILIHTDNLALLHQRQSDENRQEFLFFINDSSPQRSRGTFQRSVHSIPRSDINLSASDISAIINFLLQGKKAKLTDPKSVSVIIKELDVRRVEALANSRYLDSKKIGDIMDELKVQLYENDRVTLFQANIQRLEDLHRESIDSLETAVRFWKERRERVLEENRIEFEQMQERHEVEHAELEARWTDPGIQRKFSKRSPQLLQQKAVEKYMVLAGQLEDAEQIKQR